MKKHDMKQYDMKLHEMEHLNEVQREKITHLETLLSGAKLSVSYSEGRVKDLEKVVENLKREKAAILNENIRLLLMVREFLSVDDLIQRGDVNG